MSRLLKESQNVDMIFTFMIMKHTWSHRIFMISLLLSWGILDIVSERSDIWDMREKGQIPGLVGCLEIRKKDFLCNPIAYHYFHYKINYLLLKKKEDKVQGGFWSTVIPEKVEN